MYFEGNDNAWFVEKIYDDEIVQMLSDLGIRNSVFVKMKSPDWKGNINIESSDGSHKRGLNGFDPDIKIDGLEFALNHLELEKSKFIWNRIAKPNSECIRGIKESCPRKTWADSTKEEEISANFGKLLTDNPWLPGTDNNFHKPCELFLDDLPESFIRDEELAEKLGMKKTLRKQLPEEDQKKLKITEGRTPEEIEEALKLLDEKKMSDENTIQQENDSWIPEVSPNDAGIKTEEYVSSGPAKSKTSVEQRKEKKDEETNQEEIVESEHLGDDTRKRTTEQNIKIGKWGEEYVLKSLREEHKSQGRIEEKACGFSVIRVNEPVIEVIWLNKNGEQGEGRDFDIKEGNEVIKYIEVKTKSQKEVESFEITGTQWRLAREQGSKYYIYLVKNAGTNDAKISKIEDPHQKFLYGELEADPIKIKL